MHWLIYLYRRLRNLDKLEEAKRSTRIAIGMMAKARQEAENSQLQLATCRGLLAVAMRDRDTYEAALDGACHELATMKRKRRQERKSSRLWLTRCTQTNVGRN